MGCLLLSCAVFSGLKRSHFSSWFEPIPSYVAARGPRAIAAYQRAKATGKTLDRRVKVLLIGQDRVGKTSVARSLKGEPFRADETSTDGVQMHVPLKNPGVRPWKFSIMQGETTAYHHKCAEFIGRELLAEAKAEETRAYEEFINTFPRPTKRPRPINRLSLESLDLIVDLTGLTFSLVVIRQAVFVYNVESLTTPCSSVVQWLGRWVCMRLLRVQIPF